MFIEFIQLYILILNQDICPLIYSIVFINIELKNSIGKQAVSIRDASIDNC